MSDGFFYSLSNFNARVISREKLEKNIWASTKFTLYAILAITQLWITGLDLWELSQQ